MNNFKSKSNEARRRFSPEENPGLSGRHSENRMPVPDCVHPGWAGNTESLLASIVESSSDAIIGKDLDGTILSWNGAAEEIYGYSKEEIIGQNITILAPEEKKDEIQEILENIRRGRKVDLIETLRMRKDKGIIKVSLRVSPIRSSNGQIVGASTLARDISERDQMKKELEASQRELSKRVLEVDCLLKISKLTSDIERPLDKTLQGIVDLIPGLWLNPGGVGIRLRVENLIFESGGFMKSSMVQSGMIYSGKSSIGLIEVHYHNTGESKGTGIPELKGRRIIDTLSRSIGKYFERMKMVESLKETQIRLITEQVALKRKNQALKEVLDQIERDKVQLKHRFNMNIQKVIMPILSGLKASDKRHLGKHILFLEEALQNITSGVLGVPEDKLNRLTPREVEICNYIRNGMSTKEIAEMLRLSHQTVSKQRAIIRRKLEISNKKINMSSFIRGLEKSDKTSQ